MPNEKKTLEIVRKNYPIQEIKALDEEGFFEGLASVEIIDRDNEIVDIETLNLDEFKINPIMCYQHDAWDHRTLPIGRFPEIAKSTMSDGTKTLAYKGYITKTRPDLRTQVIDERILRTTSICFYVGDREFDEDAGVMRLKYCTLLEISIVKIPSNMLALTNPEKAYYTELYKGLLEKKPSVSIPFSVAVKDPGLFDESSLRSFVISKAKGITAMIGKYQTDDSESITGIHSVKFNSCLWTIAEANKWLDENKIKTIKIKIGPKRAKADEDMLKILLDTALNLFN